jgi:hypothetical protein
MGEAPVHASEEEADRPWEKPWGVRRDAAPHRANVLLLLGNIALGMGLASCCFGVISIPALAIGILAFAMAGHDLRLMRAGVMDRSGRRDTRNAPNRADLGLLVSLAAFLFWGALFLNLFCHDLLHLW